MATTKNLPLPAEASDALTIEHSSNMLRWSFEHSADGMLITDPKGVILMVNDAFVHIFGYPREEVVGQRTGFLRSELSTQEYYGEMWRSLKGRGEWKGEIVNRTRTGDEKICLLSITAIRSDTGAHLGYHGVEIDLTDRKRLEAQIIQGEKLAAIGESVATLVHEIRNPLNGIVMNSYMLQQAALSGSHWSEEERESVQLISREARRLDDLVKNVLSYARSVELRYERVVLTEFLAELSELVVFQAESQDVHLEIDPTAAGITGRFDPDQIKQVMLNLVQNALDAAARSETKCVRVRARTATADSWQSISLGGRVLLLEVANSGTPISEETHRQLFKPFFTTKSDGLGLGLATTAKIIRQHHGIVDVQPATEEPYTTVFMVALPA